MPGQHKIILNEQKYSLCSKEGLPVDVNMGSWWDCLNMRNCSCILDNIPSTMYVFTWVTVYVVCSIVMDQERCKGYQRRHSWESFFRYSIRTKALLCLWYYIEQMNRKLPNLQKEEKETHHALI